jgi:hypothetical protein
LTQEDLIDCINFFNRVKINVTDITTDADTANENKVVEVEYVFDGNTYQTKPLYYKEITSLVDVRDIDWLHQYFGEKVYWLDIEKHQWPKGSGESDLDNLVIDDMTKESDEAFKSFLLKLANNAQTGFFQRITRDGRPGQYYHNLENNNHWHDLVLFIKNAIARQGQDVSKEYFDHLIFNWDKGKRTSLNAGHPYKIVTDLYKNLQSIQSKMNFNNVKSLLEYKKQIILQGPPGTGKTKLAKEIARELILPQSIAVDDIKRLMKVGQTIYSISDRIPYKVETINENSISLKLENGSIQTRNYSNVIQAYSNLLENKALTGGDAYQAAIAKYIIENWDVDKVFKIIQFHPSYSYEDFVRGIVAESKGDKIEYTNVNKIFGLLAKDALENYELSKQENTDVQIDKWVNESFNDFKIEIEKDIEEKEIILSGNIGIFGADSNCFRYGKEWGNPSRINFMDFRKVVKAALTGNIKPEQNNIPKEISLHAHYRFTYYLALLRIFLNKYQFTPSSKRQEQKNFVLIIDEINRANLSSVLGELIYALEYRGEKVESMYAVDDSNELILPPNLYIIGTMNTADRSVGHIDYAIRRRFAFVDVPAKDLSIEMGEDFKSVLFAQVYNIFYKKEEGYLSAEFEPAQVCLGHSYFIQQYELDENGKKTDRKIDFGMRVKYEIVPILLEYIRDGVLKDSEGLRNKINSFLQTTYA